MDARIFIVEDDQLQRDMLAELIEQRLDYTPIVAKNGQEAIEMISEDSGTNTIHLVILDIDMPVMDGIDALKIIRSDYPHIPVIILSGKKSHGNFEACMKLGALDFMTKPFDVEKIITTIQNTVQSPFIERAVERHRE